MDKTDTTMDTETFKDMYLNSPWFVLWRSGNILDRRNEQRKKIKRNLLILYTKFLSMPIELIKEISCYAKMLDKQIDF